MQLKMQMRKANIIEIFQGLECDRKVQMRGKSVAIEKKCIGMGGSRPNAKGVEKGKNRRGRAFCIQCSQV